MYEPLVSIIIPVYNGGDYMREAIDSALSQTYQKKEVIVINDGSNDNGVTDAIAQSYGDKIRYFSKENGGVSSALNLAVTRMRGEYFSWLSHDDVYEIDKIEQQVIALNQSVKPENTVVYCNHVYIDKHSHLLQKKSKQVNFAPGTIYESMQVLTLLLKGNTFNGCCLLIPRKAIVECGLFNQEFRFCQDALMWYEIFMKSFSLIYIDKKLVRSRIHSNQLTNIGQQLFLEECEKLSEILVRKFSEISTKHNNFLKMYLLSDARFLKINKVREILELGKSMGLISCSTTFKVYGRCLYGYIRPTLRNVYYSLSNKIK